jgi:amino acid adenylation domain-containing protein
MKINILEYFREIVLKYPLRAAVIEGSKSIHFSELNSQAVKLAGMMIRKQDCVNQPVAVFLPKSIDAVIADIAITYSGNAYMNLDIKNPVERIRNILTTIEPAMIITNTQYLNIISPVLPIEIVVVNIDELANAPERVTDEDILLKRLEELIDTDPMCIINTSGSTGTPKGVVLNHRSFIDFTEWAIDTLKIGDTEIIGSLSPVVFDIFSHELCMLMSKGSTIIILPDHLAAFPLKILEIMKEYAVTYIFWVPTIMVNIANLDLFSGIGLPALKTVWFAGEVLPTKQYNYWHRHLPETMFVNLYGPIEITLDCTYYIVDREFDDSEPLPIGFACRNTSLLILNDQNKQSIDGEEGELCVRGSSLALGYYNNPEKTGAAFVQNPLNTKYPEIIYRTGDIVSKNERGEIMFKGRKDTLVKHLGYRIELAEIEHTIVNTLKLAANGCVVYDFKSKEIVLFYESTTDIPASDFRKKIGDYLPKYMIPTKYLRLDMMPMNANGKIDRLSLNKKVND